MKKITFLMAFIALLSWQGDAQVLVGTGTDVGQALPIEPYYGFTYSQSIYLASDIGANGNITGVKYFATPSTTLANSDSVTVYIAHTTRTSFASTTDWEPIATFTQAFVGVVTVTGGELLITFPSPFNYNGTDNLIIAVEEDRPAYDGSTDDFYCTAVATDRSITYRADATNPDPAAPPTATGLRQFIPNVEFQGIAQACPTPTVQTVSNISATSADLGWTENGTATTWDIEWDTTGFTQGTGVMVTGTTTNPHNITGLTANTSYDFYVRADCGGSTSAWAGPFTFTTPCTTLTLPWSEDFENAGTIPNCWSMAGGEDWLFNTAGPNHVGNNGTITGSTISDNYYGVVDASGSDAPATLTSPYVDISSLTTPQLSFYEISDNEGNANSTLDVEVWDGATWNNVGTYNTNTNGWEKKQIVLTALTFTGPAAVRFTFSETVAGDFYDDIAIDDVTFEEAPSCSEPSVLGAANIMATDADLSWTENGTATTWQIEWDTTGFVQGTGTSVVTTTNPHNLAGLTPTTSYDFYVRSVCGAGDTSLWVGPYTFVTPVSCVAPSALGALNITTTAADLGWTENGTATTWEIEWDTTNFVQGTGSAAVTTTNPHALAGLTAATSYDYYVRAVCGAGDSSVWVGPFTFTTLCAPVVAPMIESFDGTTTPMCWSQSATVGGPWVFSGSAGWAAAAFVDNTGNGGNFAWIDFSGADDAGVVLQVVDVDVSALTTPELTFALASYNTDDIDSNELYVEAWDGSAWAQVAMLTQDSSLWMSHTYSLASHTFGANLTRVRFRAERDPNGTVFYTNDLLIDDVKIDEAVITSINSTSNNVNLNVYPNPTSGLFTLNVNTTDVNELNIKVMNMHGQVVFAKNNFDNISNVNEQINLSNNAKGIYFVTVTSDKGIVTHKVVVK